MTRVIIACAVIVLLAACAPAGDPYYLAAAGQAGINATTDAQRWQAAQWQATQVAGQNELSARQTMTALDIAQERAAFELQQTQAAATITAQVYQATGTAQVRDATATATAQAAQAQATATAFAVFVAQAESERDAAGWRNAAIGTGLFFVVVVIAFLIFTFGPDIVAELREWFRMRRMFRVVRGFAISYVPSIGWVQASDMVRITEQIYPYRARNSVRESYSAPALPAPQPERRQSSPRPRTTYTLLVDALRAVGPDSDKIPGWRDLPGWDSVPWQNAIRPLVMSGEVETIPIGGDGDPGTWIVSGNLRDLVKRYEPTPSPTAIDASELAYAQ